MIADQIVFAFLVIIYLFLSITRTTRNLTNPHSSVGNKNRKRLDEDKLIKLDDDYEMTPDSMSQESESATMEDKQKLFKLILDSYLSLNLVILFIGVVNEIYLYGSKLTSNLISITLGYLLAILIILPFFYDLDSLDSIKIKSPYEYLEKRYNSVLIRAVAGFVGCLFSIGYATLFLWCCAILLTCIFREMLPIWISTTILAMFSLIGSLLGGYTHSLKIKILQLVLFLAGIITALIISFVNNKNGPPNYLWTLAEDYDRLYFISLDGDLSTKYNLWPNLFSMPFCWAGFHTLLIPNFLRYRNAYSRGQARIYFIANIPLLIILKLLFLFCGIAAFTFYYGCDPVLSSQVPSNSHLASNWLVMVLSDKVPSLAGICLASLIVFSMSQHSVSIISLKNSFIYDVIKPLFRRFTFECFKNDSVNEFMENLILMILSILGVFYCIFARTSTATVFGLFLGNINTLISPLVGLFFLSMFNKYANWFGAMISFLINVTFNIWIFLGSVMFSHRKSQEAKSNGLFLCNQTQLLANNQDKSDLPDYYPKNPVVFFLYSVNPSWYPLESVLFILIFGSLLSFIYALIRKGSFDLNSDARQERKKYLFSFKRIKFNFKRRIENNKVIHGNVDDDDYDVITHL